MAEEYISWSLVRTWAAASRMGFWGAERAMRVCGRKPWRSWLVERDNELEKWVRAAARIGAEWEGVIQVRARKVGRERGDLVRRGEERSFWMSVELEVVIKFV